MPPKPLPISTDFQTGTDSPEIRQALAHYVARPSTPQRLVDPVLRAHLASVTDENALLSIYYSIPPERGRRDWVGAILDQAARVALDNGYCWTPAMDQLVDFAVAAEAPHTLPTNAWEAYGSLVRYLERAWSPRDLTRTADLTSRFFQRARGMHMRTREYTPAQFRRAARGCMPHEIWQNRSLTPGQRDIMVDVAVKTVMAESEPLPNTPPLQFLAPFVLEATNELLQYPEGQDRGGDAPDVGSLRRPTVRQLARLAEAVTAKRLERTKMGQGISYVGHTRDLLTLLSVPRLPLETLSQMIWSVRLGRASDMPIEAYLLLLHQAALTPAMAIDLMKARALPASTIVDLLDQRPEMLENGEMRAHLAHSSATSGVLRRLIGTAGATEFPALLARAVANAPTLALEILESGSVPDGVALDATLLPSLLTHKSQGIRTRAIFLTAPGAMDSPKPTTPRTR